MRILLKLLHLYLYIDGIRGGAVNIEYGNIKNGNIEKNLTSRRGHRKR